MSTNTISTKYKTDLVQVRIDAQSKKQLESILNLLGLTTSQALLLYIKQILLRKKIPFAISAISDYDDSELTQEEFRKMQAALLARLDQGEEIPKFHERNTRPYTF